MALANFMRSSRLILYKPQARQVLPANSVPARTFFGFFIKPEYDEQGELGFPDDYDTLTGMWKKEEDWRRAGNPDPFTIGAISREDKGTKLEPILVPSAFESRTVACKCFEEQHTPIIMWLHQGEPKRCRCGFWFVLYYKEPFCDWTIPQ